jgi:hypothetical protein
MIRYVGKSNNPKKRYYDHISLSHLRTNTHKNNWIKSLLLNNNKPILNIIDEVDKKDWQLWETYWIEKLKNEGNSLTNLSEGGNGTTEHKWNTKEKLKIKHRDFPNYNKCQDRTHLIDKNLLYQKYIVENLSLNKCAKFFNTSKHTIFRNITENKFKKNKEDWKHQLSTKEKSIYYQYTISGDFIKEFIGQNSLIYSGFNPNNVISCCEGRSNKSQGYIWRYPDDNIFREVNNSKLSKCIVQIKDGEVVNRFDSIRSASKLTNIQRSSIGYCCKGILKSAGGYIWKYENNI